MRDPRVYRVYVDTSVIGGCFDKEFSVGSKRFFDSVESGRLSLVISVLTTGEANRAPEAVRTLHDDLASRAESVDITTEAIALQQAYIEAGIVSSQQAVDALHVAIATVAGCDMIVSWNFRHIVHFRKIEMYNAVNRLRGFSEIRIHTPLEVSSHAEATEEGI